MLLAEKLDWKGLKRGMAQDTMPPLHVEYLSVCL